MRSEPTSAARRWLRGIVLVLAVGLLAVPFVYPTVWMISASLLPIHEVFATPPVLVPTDPRWENYARVFEMQPFARQYLNSLYIALLVTAGSMLVATMAGYGFARVRFAGAGVAFVLVLTGMMVPSEVTIVPLFQMVQQAGLIDSHVPLIVLPVLGAPVALAVFIMRQFFLSIPGELEDAGRMDGLGRWGVLVRVAVPLAKAPLGAVAIVAFLRSWDLYLEPLVFITSREKLTVPVALTSFSDGLGQNIWNVQMAATTLSVLPVLIVFVLAQRTFVEGLTQTGLKG